MLEAEEEKKRKREQARREREAAAEAAEADAPTERYNPYLEHMGEVAPAKARNHRR